MPHNSEILPAFAQSLGGRDPKTIVAYLSAAQGLVDWLAAQPGGAPFRIELLTETVIRGHLEALRVAGRAPRTRQKALTGLRSFCRWAVAEGLLPRNPTHQIEAPTVIAVAPRELSDAQRFVLKNRVEAAQSKRLAAIFALGYWAGLRVSEAAQLQIHHCQLNQRAGVITIVDSKGGKTRTLDLHNAARRALYEYVSAPPHQQRRPRPGERLPLYRPARRLAAPSGSA